ncbi:MAG: 5-(carboxyamino)imidazole ribonucleotide synthase [Gracilimonas sp.]|uniref:5-(carboxyamino)imidazole ribonucleotide synthase n=1 Tax=Gracilimonas TaxID=649462 RepID=UPI001B2041BC|nr:5-(carboxyamino)imidazole ribonucleotide synthase [Gracilimonas sp.]MBO6587076.1 5-(carboxyamino)imidazole ribonucleotide synthase [Gracilimonas sp.]MBO6614436.1 5-(carboxyamino)imidazole ribonucleotide synthase [Gracilimonas sp.]
MPRTSIPANLKLGFLGAGQLARMSSLEAFRFGIQVAVFSDRTENEPVQFMTPYSTSGSFDSVDDMVEFAKECDVITLENEFISSDILKEVQEKSGTPIYPSPESFALIENKLIEKQTFEAAGIPVTPYKLVRNESDLEQFGEDHGWPYMLKSSKGGYDGYGNETVNNMEEAQEAFSNLGGEEGQDILAEAFVDFTKELAVQVARNETGTVVYPCCETVQKDHICVAVLSPAPVENIVREMAQELAVKATEAIDGKGIFAYEFFLTEEGSLILNESAPRPHNSGHYTIEGTVASQFENHVRAVLGLPLGSSRLNKPAVAMINLLGTHKRLAETDYIKEALAEENGHLHVYGKVDSKVGRKMAHYTLLGDNLEETYKKAMHVTRNIEI